MELTRIASFLVLGLCLLAPLQDALAGPVVRGAIVGGAVGGRRGAAIGAATGAAVGAARRAYWHGHYGHWRGHNFLLLEPRHVLGADIQWAVASGRASLLSLVKTCGYRKVGQHMSRIIYQAILCAFMLAFAAPAFAQGQSSTRIGGLTCEAAPRVGLLVGSVQHMRCTFASNAAAHCGYDGRIGRVGLDVGITGGGRLAWAVFAPTSHVGCGALRGNYVGASGSASLGVGLGANVLVGGSHRTISLQPLSVEGQLGVNLALGVSRLTLR